MASLDRCPSCTGFVPHGIRVCPNCGATEPVVASVAGSASAGDRIAFWLKAAGGSAVAMTLMACYGVPYDPNDPTDTDTDSTTSTGGTAGDTAGSTAAQTEGTAEASTGAAESSTGAADTEAGSGSSGGSDSTGGGAVDEPSLPR